MASTYTLNTGIEKPGTGEQSGTWGNTTNTNFDIIDRALSGVGAISLTGTTTTLTTTDGSLTDGMYKVLVLGGSPSGTNTITISDNTQDKVYFVVNNSGQEVVFTQGSGSNATIANGAADIIYADGAGTGATVASIFATAFKVGTDLTVGDDLTLKSDSAVLGFGADTDTTLTHTDGTGLTLNGTNKLTFGDAASFIQQSSNGVLRIDGEATIDLNASTEVNVSGLLTVGGRIVTDDTTEATSTTDGSLQTDGGLSIAKDAVFGDDVKLLSDSAVLGFGADNDTTLTHTDGTGLTLNSTNKLTFGDAASFIQQSGDGVLRIDGEATIDLNASTAVTVSNDLKLDSDAAVLGFGADNDITLTHVADSGLNLHSAATTGPVLQIGTTSTSVADDAVIGGVQFASGSSPTVNGRLFCKQYETDEDAGYFSNELRAPLGNALGEISREFVSQHAHGGIYIKRPMPANIFYYRDIYKSSNVSAATTTNLITINQNDYYCSIACQVHIMMLDPNYPTGAFQRIYGLAANTHQGRSSWSVKYTSLLDMGSYNQGANEIGSDNAYFNTDQTNSKSAGSNNGELILRVTTGTFTAASCTIHLRGMFLNALFDSQTITANL